MNLRGPSSPLMLAAMLLIGLTMAGYGVYDYQSQNSALKNSETINATIISTDVEENSVRRGTKYAPQAEFSYSFEGTDYTGSSVFPGHSSASFDTESAAREELEDYDDGETVTAYVNSKNPGEAFLKHERTNNPYIMAGIGAAIFVLSLFSYIRG